MKDNLDITVHVVDDPEVAELKEELCNKKMELTAAQSELVSTNFKLQWKTQATEFWFHRTNIAEEKLPGLEDEIEGQRDRVDQTIRYAHELELCVTKQRGDIGDLEETVADQGEAISIYESRVAALNDHITTLDDDLQASVFETMDGENEAFEIEKGIANYWFERACRAEKLVSRVEFDLEEQVATSMIAYQEICNLEDEMKITEVALELQLQESFESQEIINKQNALLVEWLEWGEAFSTIIDRAKNVEQELAEQCALNDAQETEIHSLKGLLQEWVDLSHTDIEEKENEALSKALGEAETDDEFLAIVVGYFK